MSFDGSSVLSGHGNKRSLAITLLAENAGDGLEFESVIDFVLEPDKGRSLFCKCMAA